MTVIVSKPAVNLREELASLRNQGGYQEQQFWMNGVLANPTFDDGLIGWLTQAGTSTFTVTNGQLTIARSASDSGYVYQIANTIAGAVYKATFQLVDDGPIELRIGTSPAGIQIASSGVKTVAGAYDLTFTATGSQTWFSLVNTSNSTSATIDNTLLFETDGTDVVHRMPKGWVPKDVFEDGLLQREGAAHDYEVVYDGFDYYVKPAVAPSATTQTCVIGVKA